MPVTAAIDNETLDHLLSMKALPVQRGKRPICGTSACPGGGLPFVSPRGPGDTNPPDTGRQYMPILPAYGKKAKAADLRPGGGSLRARRPLGEPPLNYKPRRRLRPATALALSACSDKNCKTSCAGLGLLKK
jgi:hypothetical protein